MRATLIHGLNATPQSNFHPWLKSELEKLGYDVCVPELPLKPGEGIEAGPLLELMHEKIGMLTNEDIVLGHSLGGVLALRYLEYVELKSTPRAFIIVGAPWRVNSPDLQSLFMTNLDFDVVPWKASEFVVVHSKDDNVVPFDHAEKWANVLKAKLIARENDGHFTDSEYPILLQIIEDIKCTPVEYKPGDGIKDEYTDNL
jgi:predicted alpha/beta hydrolase family esterase